MEPLPKQTVTISESQEPESLSKTESQSPEKKSEKSEKLEKDAKA